MYYYLKLAALSNNYTETAVLSLLLQGRSRNDIASFLRISYKQVCRIITTLYDSGVLDKDGYVQNLPDGWNFPFIYLHTDYIKEFGIGGALYYNYQRTWNNGIIGNDNQATKILGVSKRSITNYKRMLMDREFIVDGRVNVERFENVFSTQVKTSVQSKHSTEAREKIKSKLKQSDVGWIFKALCAEYGYTKVPPPLKSDIAKVMQIQKALEEDKCEVTVGDLIDRMIKKWNTLWGNKPSIPTLGHLSIYYKDLWDDPQTTTITIVSEPESVVIAVPATTEEDDIDDYNERMIGGE